MAVNRHPETGRPIASPGWAEARTLPRTGDEIQPNPDDDGTDDDDGDQPPLDLS